MLFFLHIPKTAGSTLNYIIKNNFKDKAQEIRWHWTHWIEKEELMQKLKQVDTKAKHLLHGHYVFGVHALVDQEEVKYLTFVREPLKKAISGYHHVKRDGKAQFHFDYQRKKLEDYLLDNRIFENDNGLVRRISGIGNHVPFGKIEHHHLTLAIENIDKHFLGVGITEQFDLSIALFKSLGVFQNVYYWKQNIAKNKSSDKSAMLSDAALNKWKDANRFDYALYTYCLDRFHKASEGLAFSQSKFNLGNRIYNLTLLPRKVSKKVARLLGMR